MSHSPHHFSLVTFCWAVQYPGLPYINHPHILRIRTLPFQLSQISRCANNTPSHRDSEHTLSISRSRSIQHQHPNSIKSAMPIPTDPILFFLWVKGRKDKYVGGLGAKGMFPVILLRISIKIPIVYLRKFLLCLMWMWLLSSEKSFHKDNYFFFKAITQSTSFVC